MEPRLRIWYKVGFALASPSLSPIIQRLMNLKLVAATSTLLCLISYGGAALAQQGARSDAPLIATEVRSYAVPAGFDPLSAQYAASPERVVAAATVGIDRASSCLVLWVSGEEARSFEYQHRGRPTACFGVAPGPEGVFLRGLDPTALDEVTGFTMFVDEQGAVRWSVEDEALVAAAPRSEGGTGDFIGAYGGPQRVMVVGDGGAQLVAFSAGVLRFGAQQRVVSQAHLVEVSTGRIRRSGQSFGLDGLGLVSRGFVGVGDAEYLLYVDDLLGGGDFFSYDGRSQIATASPLGVSWAERLLVGGAVSRTRGELALLWTRTGAADAEAMLSMAGSGGEARFERAYSQQVKDQSGAEIALGRPQRVVFGGEWLGIEYAVGGERWLRVVRSEDGEEVSVTRTQSLIPSATPLTVLGVGEDEALHLLGWDRAAARIREYRLAPMEVEEMEPEVGGEEMGMEPSEPMERIGQVQGSELCASVPGGAPRGGVGAVWGALGLLLWGWRRRGEACARRAAHSG